MSAPVAEPPTDLLAARDPEFAAATLRRLGRLMRLYFRAEVHGMEHIPVGGALVAANHSGGMLPMDVPIFGSAFVETFGAERPLHTLVHDFLYRTPMATTLARCGLVPTSPRAADLLLREHGSTVLVFPGGDYDACRPFYRAGTVDFAGRTGYVRTAVRAGVPIVPCVSVGGQETQLFLSRGERLARVLRLDVLARAKSLPISVGFPFGPSVMIPLNLPLPAKIEMTVLPPVDPREFGAEPDVAAVDNAVRTAMQRSLDQMRSRRRYPVIG